MSQKTCTWTIIMRNLNVLSVTEGYLHPKSKRCVYAFTIGIITQEQLKWVMSFRNVKVTERPVENSVRPDGIPIKRVFTVYLYPIYPKLTQEEVAFVQGWLNRQTWNVALWIRNTDVLYDKACDFAKMCKTHGKKATYREFISYAHLDHGRTTPDGISWTAKKLDHPALDQMLSDLIN